MDSGRGTAQNGGSQHRSYRLPTMRADLLRRLPQGVSGVVVVIPAPLRGKPLAVSLRDEGLLTSASAKS